MLLQFNSQLLFSKKKQKSFKLFKKNNKPFTPDDNDNEKPRLHQKHQPPIPPHIIPSQNIKILLKLNNPRYYTQTLRAFFFALVCCMSWIW